MRKPIRFVLILCMCSLLLSAGAALAGVTNNQCDEEGEEPDVIVGDIFDKAKYGEVGGISGFAIGTESCNVGTCWADWFASNNRHPVIAQNMYRLKDGRFEQIGQSWLKHGFATLNDPLCFTDCLSADGQHLGVHCSDPYWATLNGNQTSLGPRFEVNPETGVFPYPASMQNQSGNAIFKRLQVRNADLDLASNPGAQYWVEGQYVTQDDSAALNHRNNVSYRPVNVTASRDFNLTGETVRMMAAINAWKEVDPTVAVAKIDSGDFNGGAKVTDLGGGTWHYEYAIHNQVSERGGQSFQVPLPHGAAVTNIGFHDVDYHSGEPFDGTDWAAEVQTGAGPNSITWSTQTHDENPNANALRWGTLYNFRFDADVPPGGSAANLTLFYFKPGDAGDPSRTIWKTSSPGLCGDGFCEPGETCGNCPDDCEGDGGATCCGDDVCEGDEDACHCAADCGDGCGAGSVDGSGASTALRVAKGAGGEITLSWGESCSTLDNDFGIYEGIVGDFSSHAALQCSTGGDTTATISPTVTNAYYLVVPSNGLNEGSYGEESDSTPRPQGAGACYDQVLGECPL